MAVFLKTPANLTSRYANSTRIQGCAYAIKGNNGGKLLYYYLKKREMKIIVASRLKVSCYLGYFCRSMHISPTAIKYNQCLIVKEM